MNPEPRPFDMDTVVSEVEKRLATYDALIEVSVLRLAIVNLDPWDVLGSAEMTEHWRSVIPAISVEPVGGHGGVANDHGRAGRVRQRYVLELKHLTETKRSRGFVSSGLTRESRNPGRHLNLGRRQTKAPTSGPLVPTT